MATYFLRKIDATGLFIEDVFFDDKSGTIAIPADHIAVPVPPGFQWPRWNGSSWIEGGVPVDPRPGMWEKIKAKRDHLSELGGYKVPVAGVDKWFHSDQKSKTQQLGLVIFGVAVPPVQWKTMDGSFVTMSQTLASQIFQAAATQDMALFSAAETHRAAMVASASPAAYDFSAGWPAVLPGVA